MTPRWSQHRKLGTESDALLQELRLKDAPIPVKKIAEELDLVVYDVSEPGWDGALMSTEYQAAIWLRAEAPEERRRFALACEIGRLMLCPLGVQYTDVAPDTLWTTPAHEYASALLMPRFLVQPLMYETLMSVTDMAEHFAVPVTAMSARIDWIRTGSPDR